MKKVICGLCFISVCFFGWTAEEVSRIIAMVNNQIITSQDLNDYLGIIAYRLSLKGMDFPADEEELKRQALDSLIDDRLILSEAEKEKVVVPFNWVQERIDQMISSYPSRDDFEESLSVKGLTLTLLREKLKEQYISQQMIEEHIKAYVSVSPQEVNAYYQEHLGDFSMLVKYVIWIAKSPDKEYLREISRFIDEKGFDAARIEFEDDLIKMESQEDDLIEGVAAVLKEIKEGEYLFREINGQPHFIYLEKKITGQAVSLEDARDKIRSFLLDMKTKERFAVWIAELREKALIKIYN